MATVLLMWHEALVGSIPGHTIWTVIDSLMCVARREVDSLVCVAGEEKLTV